MAGAVLSLRELKSIGNAPKGAGNSKLSMAMSGLRRELRAIANAKDYASRMREIFGSLPDSAIDKLGEQWRAGELVFPQIEVVSSKDLGNARGGYSKNTGKIYLSRELLNSGTYEDVKKVLLEEYGHHIDQQYNLAEAIGDEGARFAGVEPSVNTEAISLRMKGTPIELEQAYKPADTRIMLLQYLKTLGITDPAIGKLSPKELVEYAKRVAPALEARMKAQGRADLIPRIGSIESPLAGDLTGQFAKSLRNVFLEYSDGGKSSLDYRGMGGEKSFIDQAIIGGELDTEQYWDIAPKRKGAPPARSIPPVRSLALGAESSSGVLPNRVFGSPTIRRIIEKADEISPVVVKPSGEQYPLTVQLFDNSGDYEAYARQIQPKSVTSRGVYDPKTHTISVRNVRETPRGKLDPSKTFLHELTHSILHNQGMGRVLKSSDPSTPNRFILRSPDRKSSAAVDTGFIEGEAELAARLLQGYDRGRLNEALLRYAAIHALENTDDPSKLVLDLSNPKSEQRALFDSHIRSTMESMLGSDWDKSTMVLEIPAELRKRSTKSSKRSGGMDALVTSERVTPSSVSSIMNKTAIAGVSPRTAVVPSLIGASGGGVGPMFEKSKQSFNRSKFEPMTLDDLTFIAERLGGRYEGEIPAVVSPSLYVPLGEKGHIKGQFPTQNRQEGVIRFDTMDDAIKFMKAVTGAGGIYKDYMEAGILPMAPFNMRAYTEVYGTKGRGNEPPVKVRFSMPTDPVYTSSGRVVSSEELDSYYRGLISGNYDLRIADNTESRKFKSGQGATNVEARVVPFTVNPNNPDRPTGRSVLRSDFEVVGIDPNVTYLDRFGRRVQNLRFDEAKNSFVADLRGQPIEIDNPNSLRIDRSVLPKEVRERFQKMSETPEQTVASMREILQGAGFKKIIPDAKQVGTGKLSTIVDQAARRVWEARGHEGKLKDFIKSVSAFDEQGKRQLTQTLYNLLDELGVDDTGKLAVASRIASGREFLPGDRSPVVAVGQEFRNPEGKKVVVTRVIKPSDTEGIPDYLKGQKRKVDYVEVRGESGTRIVPAPALDVAMQVGATYFSDDLIDRIDPTESLAMALKYQRRLRNRGESYPRLPQSFEHGVITPKPSYEDFERSLVQGNTKLLPADVQAGRYVPSVEMVGDTSAVRTVAEEVDPRLFSKSGKPLRGGARQAVLNKIRRERLADSQARAAEKVIVDPMAGRVLMPSDDVRQALIERDFFGGTQKRSNPFEDWIRQRYQAGMDSVAASAPSTKNLLPMGDPGEPNPVGFDIVGRTGYTYNPPNLLQRAGTGISNFFGGIVRSLNQPTSALPSVFNKFGGFLGNVRDAADLYRAEQVARYNRLALPEAGATTFGTAVPRYDVVGDTSAARTVPSDVDIRFLSKSGKPLHGAARQAVLDKIQGSILQQNAQRNAANVIADPMVGTELQLPIDVRNRMVEQAFFDSFRKSGSTANPFRGWSAMRAVERTAPSYRNLLPMAGRYSALMSEVVGDTSAVRTVPINPAIIPSANLTPEEIVNRGALDESRTRSVLRDVQRLSRSPDFNPSAVADRFGVLPANAGDSSQRYLDSLSGLMDFLEGKVDQVPAPVSDIKGGPRGYAAVAEEDDLVSSVIGKSRSQKARATSVERAKELAAIFPSLADYEQAIARGNIEDVPMVRNLVALQDQVKRYVDIMPAGYLKRFDQVGLTPFVSQSTLNRVALGMYEFPFGTGALARTGSGGLSTVRPKLGNIPNPTKVYTPDELKVLADQGINANLYVALFSPYNQANNQIAMLNYEFARLPNTETRRRAEIEEQIRRLNVTRKKELARLKNDFGITGLMEAEDGKLKGWRSLPLSDLPDKPRGYELNRRKPDSTEMRELLEKSVQDFNLRLLNLPDAQSSALSDLLNKANTGLGFDENDPLAKAFIEGRVQFERSGSNRYRVGDGRFGVVGNYTPEQMDAFVIDLFNNQIRRGAFARIEKAEKGLSAAWKIIQETPEFNTDQNARKLVGMLTELDRSGATLHDVNKLHETAAYKALPKPMQSKVDSVLREQANLVDAQNAFASEWEDMIDPATGRFNKYAWRNNAMQTILGLEGGDYRYMPVSTVNTEVGRGSKVSASTKPPVTPSETPIVASAPDSSVVPTAPATTKKTRSKKSVTSTFNEPITPTLRDLSQPPIPLSSPPVTPSQTPITPSRPLATPSQSFGAPVPRESAIVPLRDLSQVIDASATPGKAFNPVNAFSDNVRNTGLVLFKPSNTGSNVSSSRYSIGQRARDVFGHLGREINPRLTKLMQAGDISSIDLVGAGDDFARVVASEGLKDQPVSQTLTVAGLQTAANLGSAYAGGAIASSALDLLNIGGPLAKVATTAAKFAAPIVVNVLGENLRKPTKRHALFAARVRELTGAPMSETEYKVPRLPGADGHTTFRFMGEETNLSDLVSSYAESFVKATPLHLGTYAAGWEGLANALNRDTLRKSTAQSVQNRAFEAGLTFKDMARRGAGKIVVGKDGGLEPSALSFRDWRELSLRNLLDKRNYEQESSFIRSKISNELVETPNIKGALSASDFANLRQEGYSDRQVQDYLDGKTKVLGVPELSKLREIYAGARYISPDLRDRTLESIREKYNRSNYIDQSQFVKPTGGNFGSQVSAALSAERNRLGLRGGERLTEEQVRDVAERVSNNLGFSFGQWVNRDSMLGRSPAPSRNANANVPTKPVDKASVAASRKPVKGGWWS